MRMVQEVEDRTLVLEWPSLTLQIDQGSDGWCAQNFLRHMRLCVAVLPDDNHRRWNDVMLAIKAAPSMHIVLLLTEIVAPNQVRKGQVETRHAFVMSVNQKFRRDAFVWFVYQAKNPVNL